MTIVKRARAYGARLTAALLLALAALTFSGSARAEDPLTTLTAPQAIDRPWAKDVSAEQQKEATARFLEGNALLKESFFAEAAAKYRDALTYWDHPGIHYNLALALLTLDQPMETHEQLQRALKYGAGPLDEDKYDHAKNLLLVIDGQLATIEVHCNEPGAVVRLDGQLLFHAPGQYKGLARRGEHTVTASKEGFETTQRTKTLGAGATVFNLELYRPDDLLRYRRRWPVWGPVVATAGGALVLGAGALFTLQSRAKYKDFDATIAARQTCKTGCFPDSALADVKKQGDTYKTLATISYVTGGTVLAGGIVLLVLNRQVSYRVEPGERTASLTVLPAVQPGLLGVFGSGHF